MQFTMYNVLYCIIDVDQRFSQSSGTATATVVFQKSCLNFLCASVLRKNMLFYGDGFYGSMYN